MRQRVLTGSLADRDFVPGWARDAVWYQVFPERFRNGSSANDPVDLPIPGWKVSSWGQDWYRQEPWERLRGGFFDSVYHRRFGGDLLGLREKLGYLQDLGVNALYLNPVFMAPSLHKYDASCLHHIDPTFGPDRDGDLRLLARAGETEDPSTWVWTSADRFFVDLVREIHQRGMRIIIDGVFNHSGRDFFAFRDLLIHGRRSRYRNWYRIDRWHADGRFDYTGWFGHAGLPEFARTSSTLAAPVRRYVFDCTRRWMDPDGDGNPSDGVDGWRLDVAFCVPSGFWRSWRRHVKAINPDAYLTAEIVSNASEWVRGDQFDAVMNYAWLLPTYAMFAASHRGRGLPVKRFQKQLDDLRASYPEAVNQVLQNLIESHDVGRMVSMLANPVPLRPLDFQRYFEASRVAHTTRFDVRRPASSIYRRLRQLVVFQMTYVGAPMLYYGAEVGMWGANDPCDRQPMLWEDLRYEPETHTQRGRCRPRARKPDLNLKTFYKALIALRRRHVALRRGSFAWHPVRWPRVLAYERRSGSERILILMNLDTRKRLIPVKGPARVLSAGGGSVVAPGRALLTGVGWLVLQLLDKDTPSV